MIAIAGQDLEELRSLTRAEALKRFGATDDDLVRSVGYGQIEGVDRLDPEGFPGHLFFRGDQLVMVYVPQRSLTDVSPATLLGELGKPEALLASRAGADSTYHVYPGRGIAFSADQDTVEMLEAFPPMTLEAYKTQIHYDPGEFIR